MDWVCTEIGRTFWVKPQSRFTGHFIGYILKNGTELHKCWIIICVICAVRKAQSLYNFLNDFFKKTLLPRFGFCSTPSRLQSHYEEILTLIWSSPEVWKAKSTLEPRGWFEPRFLEWETSALTTKSLSRDNYI